MHAPLPLAWSTHMATKTGSATSTELRPRLFKTRTISCAQNTVKCDNKASKNITYFALRVPLRLYFHLEKSSGLVRKVQVIVQKSVTHKRCCHHNKCANYKQRLRARRCHKVRPCIGQHHRLGTFDGIDCPPQVIIHRLRAHDIVHNFPCSCMCVWASALISFDFTIPLCLSDLGN